MGLISKYRTQMTDGPDSCTTRHLRSGVRYLGKAASLVCAYYLTAVLSLQFAIPPGVVSPLWPPSAIALCACLLWGQRMVPAVWLAATLANWSAGLPLSIASAIAIGNGLEAFMATVLIQHLARKPLDFSDSGNIFKFIGIVAASSMCAATIGVTALAVTGRMSPESIAHSWLTWWLGNAAAIIVIAPLILAWNTGPGWRRQTFRHTHRLVETVSFALLLPAVTHIVFGDVFGRWPLALLPIPFVIWAAFRFNLSSITWTTALICVIVVWDTAQGHGPFAMESLNTSLLLALVYTSIVGAIGLILSSLVSQHRISEQRLRQERDRLERRVESRTSALEKDIEQRKRVETELATRESQLAEAQHLAQVGSWNWDLASNAITWSDELYRIYGVRKDRFAVTPDNCSALIHAEDVDALRRIVEKSRATGSPFQVEHRIVLPAGDIRTVAARGFVALDDTGRVVRIFGTTQDVTEAKRAELALREAEERYRMVVELCPDAILVHQHGVLTFANHAAAVLLGAADINRIIGRPILEFIHPACRDIARECIAIVERGETTVPRIEKKFIRVDGSPVDVDIHSSSFMVKGEPAVLLIVRDITERKKSAEQMAYLAHYDSLTGLPNRTLFHQRLAHALNLAERPGTSVEILFLDLDRFKYINDTLGHAIGDMVLRETALRLQSILRESDTVARLGGDEFVVLVENVDEPHRGGTIAEKIFVALTPPFMRNKEPLCVSASIGISSFPADGSNAETLLKKADIAMYRAKESGRSAYRYYSAEMNRHTTERLALESALSRAIQDRQLSLHYQPQVDALSNRITGMEALLRWQHPTIGWVPPPKFISLAEETGMINAIGRWAIRAACMQNKRWQEAGTERLKVAVNLSPLQLADENLLADIQKILDDTGLDARYLELEITESAIMANPEQAIRILGTLRDMGVSVAIDDFGIAYSSLAYLKKFPIHAVKIDRSFVTGVPENRGDSAITKAIIGLAHSLECSVVAEGAETQRQFEFLRDHDCDSVQGFYFSKPVCAERFAELLYAQSEAVSRLH